MKRKGFHRCISVLLSLCMVLSCVTLVSATVGAATISESEDSAVSAAEPNENFSWDNASVYFLLTDRFKNGNTSNDHSYGRGKDNSGNVVSGIDTRATFHGGDFAGVTQAIEEGYFTNLGVNALWISAPYEQIHGYVVGDDSGSSFAHYSYHGYYVLDYTQTDANFGTAQEFETLVDTAHEYGLRVIIDIVMNHSGYNSIYDMSEYGFGTVKSGWENSYFSHQNINNSTYHSFIDYDSSASDWAKWWGPNWIRCGVAGYTPGGNDDVTKLLAGLPDFKTESSSTAGIPALLQTKWTREGRLSQETNELNAYLSKTGKTQTVTNTISYWLSTWVREYGVDGFRCDTAKHVGFDAWKTLKDTCVDALKEWRTNNPNKPGANWDEDFWMTGECWDHNIGWGYDGYYTQGGFDSMINFETQGGGLLNAGQIADIYSGYASAINTNDKFNQLSYLSSHDSTLARGSLIQTGSAFLLLPGGIQIFYGDETNRPYVSGIPNDGNGGAGHSLRSDMNWDSIDTAVLEHWQKVGTFRNNHISVGAGSNTKLSSTSGTAFGRTYNKNGISDKVAGVVYASANSDVTIDVSALWSDGQQLMNAYDQASAQVVGGKVTFNSGANGTILIQEPDGRPLMTVKGNAKFVGSQTVTVSLENCETAKCSIDGGNKFTVENGSTFAIGSTGYDGDTIKITLEASNEKGTSTSTATFTKVAAGEDVTEPSTAPTEPPKNTLYVKTWDGSAPYAYVWEGDSTALIGAWPGTKLTQKNSEGYYYIDLNPTQSTYNVVMNNGSGTQSADITGLSGEAYLEVTDSSYYTKIVSSGNPDPDEPTEDSVTIRVKPYNTSSTYYLYLWDDNDTSLIGSWPGKALSTKDDDGNYVYTLENTSSVNAIVNLGSGAGQTADIKGVSGDVTIEITDAGCTSYKLTKNEKPVSGIALLKKEAREVLAMTSTDYTATTWSALQTVMTSANSLIAQGDGADEAMVTSVTTQLQSAKAALKLVQPKLTYAVTGKNTISGIAVADAEITVTVNGNTYKTTSDDVTGAFSVTATTLSSTMTVKIDVSRKGISAPTYSYSMSNGNVNTGEVPTSPTSPTQGTDPTTPTNPVVTDGYYLRGNITLSLSQTSLTNVYRGSVELPAGTYKFVVEDAANNISYGRATTYTNSIDNDQFGNNWGYCTLKTTGGKYTFTFNTKNKYVAVDCDKAPASNFSTYKVRGSVNVALAKTANTGIIKNTVDLPAGDYRFVVTDSATGISYGRSKAYTGSIGRALCGNNWGYIEFTADKTGTYEFIYNTTTKYITVLPASAQDSDYCVIGDNIGFNFKKATANTVTQTVTLEAGSYDFVVSGNNGASYLGRNTVVDDTVSNALFGKGWGWCTLNATGGEYTFTYNTSTNRLTITKA